MDTEDVMTTKVPGVDRIKSKKRKHKKQNKPPNDSTTLQESQELDAKDSNVALEKDIKKDKISKRKKEKLNEEPEDAGLNKNKDENESKDKSEVVDSKNKIDNLANNLSKKKRNKKQRKPRIKVFEEPQGFGFIKNKKIKFDNEGSIEEQTQDNAAPKNINQLEDEESIKEEDIDKFCEEITEEDNKQYENWINLFESNFGARFPKKKI